MMMMVLMGQSTVQKLMTFVGFFEDNRIDLGAQELILMEAANGLMSKLRFLLEPLKFVTDDGTPWEEKSAVVRLSDKINKSKRNKLWRKRKRRRVAESLAKEEEQFKKLDREADEWRAKEIAKDMVEQKVEKMKVIAKQKAKEERKKLEAELELALMVEKLQELRSVRIQKFKKQDNLNRSKTNHPTSLNRAETQPQKQNSHNHQSRNTATTIRAETQPQPAKQPPAQDQDS